MADNKLRYFITGNAAGLNKALASASSKVQAFGSKIKGVGASLQKFSAIGAVAGGAAIKMAMDFDKNITQINALVGTAGEALQDFSDAAKRVAKETGISSAKTSEAMFFIASAGLEGAEAIDVLDAAAKASASGLGDVATIADLATSAMNAYGSENLNATAATDILTAAVREGKLEASALAGSMGSVIPTASALGVSFDEVGAAMAAMSRTGTDAASGATQLNAILMGLTKTTPAAQDAFRAMGLNSQELRDELGTEGGLISVLGKLKIGIDSNADAAAAIFPNIRALKGVLDLTGAGAEDARKIFDELSRSQGATAKAFDVTSRSASFKLNKAMNNAKESFKEVGTVLLTQLLPPLTGLLNIIKNALTAFTNLDPATQRLISGLGLLALALPTLISLFGSLVSIVGALMSPAVAIAGVLAGIAYIIYKNWGEVAPIIVGLYNQFVDLYNSSVTLRKAIFGVGAVFKTVFVGIKVIVMEFVNVFRTVYRLIKAFSEDGIDAAFGDILEQGFEDGKQIAIDGAKEIGEAFSDGMEDALGSQLEKKSVEQLNTTLTNVADFAKGKLKGVFNNFMGGFGQSTAGDPEDTQDNVVTTITGGDDDDDKVGETTEKVSKLKIMLDMLKDSADAVGEGIKGAFLGAFDAMMQGENIFKALGQMLLDLIKKFVAAALAAFVLSALVKSIFPAAGSGGGAFEGLKDFKSLFGSFAGIEMAKGGIVSTPTLATVGEYPGAKQNPEVIAPLDKLKNLIGESSGTNVQVGGQFTLKGQDLVVALQRADRNRNRIK
tara:strand:- start:12648 stop:14996 length:2349 start_codon:yes stop_codon:yes gene_type:complete